MSDRIQATYRYWGESPEQLADAIRVEQTIEFPFDLAPSWIQRDVVASAEGITAVGDGVHDVVISYDPRTVAGELPQLLNVLWGNVSMFPGVKLIGLELPDSFTKTFSGPRFGVPGLRDLLQAPSRALVSTALKPMGLSAAELGEMAYTLAAAGFDTIKDDHSLANQPWAPWRERVQVIADAVAKANDEHGTHCLYAPSIHLPANQLHEAAMEAKKMGATALLLLPGISGFDTMRAIAEDDDIGLPVMGHPSMLGSLAIPERSGIHHSIVFGTLMRLAGADITIFPNFGGRFSFSEDECLSIDRAATEPLGSLAASWVSPAGGMTVERVPEMLEFYGPDTACLIGGALHRGDLASNARAMVAAIAQYRGVER